MDARRGDRYKGKVPLYRMSQQNDHQQQGITVGRFHILGFVVTAQLDNLHILQFPIPPDKGVDRRI